MATTERQGTTWHYGQITKTTWTTPTQYVYTGGTSPDLNMARLTFSNMARIDNIGPILSMRIYADTLNTSQNYGDMYVSASALAPNQVKTSGKLIGRWKTLNGDPAWFSVTSFSAANLIAGIGSATTWYCYWINDITSSRTLFYPNSLPKWELTYNPGLMRVATSASAWASGSPYVWNGSSWVRGTAYVWNGSSWVIGK
jgi:hypothetical protein